MITAGQRKLYFKLRKDHPNLLFEMTGKTSTKDVSADQMGYVLSEMMGYPPKDGTEAFDNPEAGNLISMITPDQRRAIRKIQKSLRLKSIADICRHALGKEFPTTKDEGNRIIQHLTAVLVHRREKKCRALRK
ncbi:MAG: hypothetical protein GY765_11275 [bacterium]|nr:hypothetical protein [bacterium]